VVQVEQVVASYRASYCEAGDIDELDFLSHEDYLVIPSLADRSVALCLCESAVFTFTHSEHGGTMVTASCLLSNTLLGSNLR